MASMSPCTIEKDVLDEMKKFRRQSNKSTMAMLCKWMTNDEGWSLFRSLVRCDMKNNQVVIEKEMKVSDSSDATRETEAVL